MNRYFQTFTTLIAWRRKLARKGFYLVRTVYWHWYYLLFDFFFFSFFFWIGWFLFSKYNGRFILISDGIMSQNFVVLKAHAAGNLTGIKPWRLVGWLDCLRNQKKSLKQWYTFYIKKEKTSRFNIFCKYFSKKKKYFVSSELWL